jgi:hypothetical protein
MCRFYAQGVSQGAADGHPDKRTRVGGSGEIARIAGRGIAMRWTIWLALAAFATNVSAYCAEENLGNWDMARVVWYREHPEQTKEKLRWCVEHHVGDAECGAAMQACNDLIDQNPSPMPACASPMIR